MNSIEKNTLIKIIKEDPDTIRIKVQGNIAEEKLSEIDFHLRRIEREKPHVVIIDLSVLQKLPTSLALLFAYYDLRLSSKHIKLELIAEDASFRRSLEEAKAYWERKYGSMRIGDPLEVLWTPFAGFFSKSKELLSFVGELLLSSLDRPWRRSRAHKGTLINSLHQVGVGGIPIVVLISLLLGLVMAFMSSMQLEQFGAQIYVASLLTLAMTKELGPIMTGILIAGRSGSAFASELGTMKLSEEIDALNSMGFDVIKFLVLPKLIATAISLPILSFFSQFSGILGGLLVAVSIMGITPQGYWDQVFNTLRLFDIWWGVLKCVVFGLLVASIGCHEGLKVEKGASSVGQAATQAVVKGIFAVILFDSIFAIILVYW